MAGDQDLAARQNLLCRRNRLRGKPIWGLGIVAVALTLRLIYQLEIRSHPLSRHLFLDPAFYHRWAQTVVSGDWLSHWQGIFYANPLYPYFLAFIYTIVGETIFGVKLLQSLMGVAICLMIAVIGRRFFDRSTGFVAGLLAALYAPFIFYEGTLTIATLGMFLSVLSILLLVTGDRLGGGRSLGAGLAWGFRALARFDASFLAVPIWLLALKDGRSMGRRIFLTSLFCLGICATVLPVTIRNYAIGGKLVGITAHGGETFYAGNNPLASGTYAPERGVRPGTEYEHEDFRQIASQRAGRWLSLDESSSYWLRQALVFISQNPGQWLRLELRKLLLFWGPREIPDNRNFHYFRQFSEILQLPLVTFAVLCPVALLGLTVALSIWRRCLLLYLQIALSMLSVLIFFVSSRYRLPTVPFLLIFAAYGLTWSSHKIRRRKWGPLIACWLPTLALLIFMCFQARDLGEMGFATRRETLSVALIQDGRVEEGIAQLEKVIAQNPRRITAHFNLGVAYLEEQNRPGLAVRELRQVIQMQENYPRAHYMLAKAYGAMDRQSDALGECKRELDFWPRDIAVRLELGLTLVRLERWHEAEEVFRQVIEQRFEDPIAHRSLGNVLYLQGRLREALESWERAQEQGLNDDGLRESIERLKSRLEQ